MELGDLDIMRTASIGQEVEAINVLSIPEDALVRDIQPVWKLTKSWRGPTILCLSPWFKTSAIAIFTLLPHQDFDCIRDFKRANAVRSTLFLSY